MKRILMVIMMLFVTGVSIFYLNMQGVFAAPATGSNTTLIVHNVKELMATEQATKKGHVTVLIEDGVYVLPKGLWLTGTDLTYKSRSGNRNAVVLRGNFKASHIFWITSNRVTLQDMSLGEVTQHGVQVLSEKQASQAVIRNIRFFDIKQQMLKASGDGHALYSKNCLVENCLFEFTEGTAYQAYTGGIDVHKGMGWIVRNNTFQGIVGPNGSLTEGAIHFWDDSRNTIIENNLIHHCDRGILLGLDKSSHIGGMIRNNAIHTVRDTGIYLANANGAKVYNNTVYVDSPYPAAIEYRFAGTKSVDIVNNLTNKAIVSRNGGSAISKSNLTFASVDWFVSVETGDLHLKAPNRLIVDRGYNVEAVTTDMDGTPRLPGKLDIGADEWQESPVLNESGTGDIPAVPSRYDAKGHLIQTQEEPSIPQDANKAGADAKVLKTLLNLQAGHVTLRHLSGQTFITWEEIVRKTVKPTITIKELVALKSKDSAKVTYNIYRSNWPILSVNKLQPIAVVDAWSGWNFDFYGINGAIKDKPAFRYVIQNGKGPVPNGSGIWVNNPDEAGKSYYAVTVTVNGVENRKITDSNAPSKPVNEIVSQGIPVLQRVEHPASFLSIKGATLYYYTRWEAPPNCSIKGQPMDYLVAVPPMKLKTAAPVGIHMHCWGGNLESGYSWWNNAETGSLLLASNQLPYDWWTGYQEQVLNAQPPLSQTDWESGVVHPYATNRLFSFLSWMSDQPEWSIDLSKTFTAGTSMGGSGSIMAAIRQGNQVAWARGWVGVHTPMATPTYRINYEQVYGNPDYQVFFESGDKVWDYYNDVWYLQNHPTDETGFITFSNGKNDNAIGWLEAVNFYKALQDTKRPHIFVWGQDGHNQKAIMPINGGERNMPIDIKTNQSLPAFTHCSLDDVPGNGDPGDGDPEGQINAYLYWETSDLMDTPTQWGITVALSEKAPQKECAVDITPRRLQRFRTMPREVLKWTNKDVLTGKVISEGTVAADVNGLVTLPSVTVSKNQNRIELYRIDAKK